MSSLHLLDLLVIAAYVAIVITIGRIAAKGSSNQEGFFLAGRKLGKLYQFFLNFGNSTDANSAVSTTSVVYQQGVSGVWVGFQMIFLNPYYWFMFAWLRRVRLTTIADIFEDRLGSARLALFYAVFQIIMAIAVTIGYGNLVSYKISAAIVTKPEATWTAGEQQAVAEYRELKSLEKSAAADTLTIAAEQRLALLRDRDARGELRSFITALEPWSFYLLYTLVVGIYIVMGGMSAAALNEAFQGVLIIVFSVMLIPAGIAAIGGWDQLRERVPERAFEMVASGGVSQFTGWAVAAVFLATLMTAHGNMGNMAIAGSARSEFAARFGAVTGTFGKRVMTVAWAFAGLIAIGLYAGADALSDPDLAWGTMSRALLGPGLLGLMLAGVLAANMSTIAAQTMGVSALFARNVYRPFRGGLTDGEAVVVGRWTIVAVLLLGIVVATQMTDVFSVLQFAMTMNVPFGASIWLMLVWRRVTVAAVWAGVVSAAVFNIVIPLVAQHVSLVNTRTALVVQTSDAVGRPSPVFFESVVRTRPEDAASPLQGRGRFHTELVLLKVIGVNVSALSPGGRFAGRFFVDSLLPIFVLVVVSLFTRAPPRERVDQFFGKMKTRVGGTPEEERAMIEETLRHPHRFDHLKLFPGSSWEFTKWDREDTIGFVAACVFTGVVIGAFWAALRWVAG